MSVKKQRAKGKTYQNLQDQSGFSISSLCKNQPVEGFNALRLLDRRREANRIRPPNDTSSAVTSCLPRIHVPELDDTFSKYPKALLSRSCCTCIMLLHLILLSSCQSPQQRIPFVITLNKCHQHPPTWMGYDDSWEGLGCSVVSVICQVTPCTGVWSDLTSSNPRLAGLLPLLDEDKALRHRLLLEVIGCMGLPEAGLPGNPWHVCKRETCFYPCVTIVCTHLRCAVNCKPFTNLLLIFSLIR